MTSLICKRTTCRLCGGPDLKVAVPLAPVPIATPNIGVAGSHAQAIEATTAPLDLYQCGGCGHLQLLDVVDPGLQYGNYLYATSVSQGLAEHFAGTADDVMEQAAPPAGALVVEMGSNDGTLLGCFKDRGLSVLGIDPAKRIAEQASANGIETWAEFFTPGLARRIVAERGPAAVVLANNVFANIDDLDGVIAGVQELLAPDGVFVFETQNGADVIRHTLLDTIYHEHLSYFLIKPLAAFFAAREMDLIDVAVLSTKGGSMRVTVQRAGGPRSRSAAVAETIAAEERDGLYDPATYAGFAAGIDALRQEMAALVGGIAAGGGTLAGYGTSVGTVTLLHQFDLASSIGFLVDDMPLKSSLVGPGYALPILPPAALYEKKPDAVIVFAWRYAETIMGKHRAYVDGGGRFVVPLPRLSVVETGTP